MLCVQSKLIGGLVARQVFNDSEDLNDGRRAGRKT